MIGSLGSFLQTVLLNEKGEMCPFAHLIDGGIGSEGELREKGSCKMTWKYEGSKNGGVLIIITATI